MSILVTGGAGFIGSHFLEHLVNTTAERLVCFDNFNDYYDPALKRANISGLFGNPRVQIVRGDFCKSNELLEIMRRYQVRWVMHLGGMPGVRYSVENPRVYQEVNVLGTLSVLEACEACKVERVVNVSSSTVYGHGAQTPFVEDAPLGVPLSPYGVSKRAAELLALTWHQLHSLPTVSVRMFSVYGKRLRPDLAMSIFAEKMLRGESLPLFGDGSIRRDFTHVRDICRGLASALFTPHIEGEIFNLGHNEPIAIREVIQALEHGLNCRARIQQRPERPEDMPVTQADLTKSKALLNYSPRVTFEAGCAEYCDWYLNTHSPTRQTLAA